MLNHDTQTTEAPKRMKKTPIILIPGTWCTAEIWGDFVPALEALGLQVLTPNLRYHGLPYDEVAKKVGNVSLTEFVDDLSTLLLSLDTPPIILGHSLGGLLAQLLAARHPDKHIGVILLGTAPMAGIFAFYPETTAVFYKHYMKWRFWEKTLYADKAKFEKYVMNNQTQDDIDDTFAKLVPESGRVYFEMGFWYLDAKKAATVDTDQIQTPVLVITGTDDKIVNANISRATAKKYANSTLCVFEGSDHMYAMGEFMPITVNTIKSWLDENHLL